MPYISASIMLQLFSSVYPPLEKLKKEGESGQKKINEYTRYLTVVICLVQSAIWMRIVGLGAATGGHRDVVIGEYADPWSIVVAIVTMTAGTVFLMWIGEQIDEYGIGNGISLIIMAGIVARIPDATSGLLFERGQLKPSIFMLGGSGLGDISLEKLIVLMILFVAIVVGVIAITKGQRRIPTQSAKHVRGRRVYGGSRQYLPLRVNTAGVMPVIFASSLLLLPVFLFQFLYTTFHWDWAAFLEYSFKERGYLYNIAFVVLIYFFCYFWTAIIYNPKDIANNLKDHGSFIPGYRPGKRTAEYLEKVMIRITYVGAAFLAVVAIIPTIINNAMEVDYMVASFYGGTGLLIVISVALDLVQKINSHLVMRGYPVLTED